VDLCAVMVIDETGRVQSPGAPARPGEFARHKLLDLLGDTYLYGGIPRGRLRAVWPGHAANHDALRRALAAGIVQPVA
jgi:UDP-3-O-[3-hydroxymyristoyl] N-acetylglucosamine deacetylase